MTRMFTLLGDASPSLIASSVLSFESKIAEFTLPLEELRDPERIYNKYNITSIQQLANLHWIHFFNATRIPYDTLDANVQVPKFMIKLAELIDATPIADLQNYLKYSHYYTITHHYYTPLTIDYPGSPIRITK